MRPRAEERRTKEGELISEAASSRRSRTGLCALKRAENKRKRKEDHERSRPRRSGAGSRACSAAQLAAAAKRKGGGRNGRTHARKPARKLCSWRRRRQADGLAEARSRARAVAPSFSGPGSAGPLVVVVVANSLRAAAAAGSSFAMEGKYFPCLCRSAVGSAEFVSPRTNDARKSCNLLGRRALRNLRAFAAYFFFVVTVSLVADAPTKAKSQF